MEPNRTNPAAAGRVQSIGMHQTEEVLESAENKDDCGRIYSSTNEVTEGITPIENLLLLIVNTQSSAGKSNHDRLKLKTHQSPVTPYIRDWMVETIGGTDFILKVTDLTNGTWIRGPVLYKRHPCEITLTDPFQLVLLVDELMY